MPKDRDSNPGRDFFQLPMIMARVIIGRSIEPRKRAQLYGMGTGQRLVIIFHAWSGCVGGLCLV